MAPAPSSPDPRVDQANERTLLAWVRTGVGLMAFGFVVARAGAWLRYLAGEKARDGGALSWLGMAFVALGSVASVFAAIEYARIRRAVRDGRPVATGRLAPALALFVALLGLALIALLAAGRGP